METKTVSNVTIMFMLLSSILVRPLAAAWSSDISTHYSDSIHTYDQDSDVSLLYAPAAEWNKTYGGTNGDAASPIVHTSDKGYATAGYTIRDASGFDFWLVKTDASGNMYWNQTYGGPNVDQALDMVQTSDGGYALVGRTSSYGAGIYDLWLVKTDAAGTLQWSQHYGGTGFDEARSVVQTSDEGFIIAGSTNSSGAGDADFWLVKTDASGNVQWSETYGGTSTDVAHSVILTVDGGYALAGYTNSFGSGASDFWFVKTDSAGTKLWDQAYGGLGDERASCLIPTGDGGYALAGYTRTFGAGVEDSWLVKTDSAGNMQWSQAYGGAADDRASSLVQTGDGGYALAGSTGSSGAGSLDFWLVKTNSAGTMQWNKAYGGAGEDRASSLVQMGDKGYALTGYTLSYGAGSYDFWLVKTGLTPGVDRQLASFGQNVNITIPVKNEGTATETFDVKTYNNSTAIETKTVKNLAPNTETTLSFIWHITNEPFGNYIISAYAHSVPGETDIADNNCTAGIVRVVSPWGDWNHYHNYTEIVDTLLYLNDTYPHIVDLFSIGRSWENKDIYCIRLTNESNTHPKPEVFFAGYHHAREPISAELPLYFAVDAATNYGTNATITHMINYSEVYIVVALNVDAFEALEQNEWQRKNVHPYDEDDDLLLDEDPPDDEDGDGYIEDLWQWDGYQWVFLQWEGADDDSDGSLNEDWIGGVDLNRNYGYQWDAECDSGSPYPWAEDYHGPTPFSEPETQEMRDFALIHDFKYAISFHSGSDVIIYPWGYTNSPTPDDQLFREIAGNLSSRVGSPYEQSSIMYTTSGVWDDWMYGNRSTLALTCEVYENSSAWQYEPGPYPDSWWEKGIFQAFNPNPSDIAQVIQKWLPTFTYITNRAISEAYDVATTNVTPLKTAVGQSYSMNISVTVANKGEFLETFQVTAYANTEAFGSQLVVVAAGNSTTVTFTWDTAGFAIDNYVISAGATPIPGETHTSDNIGTGGTVKVTTAGNVDGDTDVGSSDLSILNLAYGSNSSSGYWNANCDINNDGKVDALDLRILGKNYGKTDP